MTVTIVSSQIVTSNPQIDGRFSVREHHIDSLNKDYFFDYLADLSVDQNAHLTANATSILPSMAAAEIISNIAQVTTLGSLASPTVVYSTAAANAATLRGVYTASTQVQAIMLGDYLNSLSNVTLQSAFGWTTQQVTNLRTNFLAPAAISAATIRATVGG